MVDEVVEVDQSMVSVVEEVARLHHFNHSTQYLHHRPWMQGVGEEAEVEAVEAGARNQEDEVALHRFNRLDD